MSKKKSDKKAKKSGELILDANEGDAQAQTVSTVPTEDNQDISTAAVDGPKKLSKKEYKKELERLRLELVNLQKRIRLKGLKVVVIFEGAGKGSTIKRITEGLKPRYYRVVTPGNPTKREKTQWYFQRYVQHLPAAGEIVLFDESWYDRSSVERVKDSSNEEEYQEFLRSFPEFENLLIRSGFILIKSWFSVSNEDAIFAISNTEQAPWNVVSTDDKKLAILNAITHLLSQIPYEDPAP